VYIYSLTHLTDANFIALCYTISRASPGMTEECQPRAFEKHMDHSTPSMKFAVLKGEKIRQET